MTGISVNPVALDIAYLALGKLPYFRATKYPVGVLLSDLASFSLATHSFVRLLRMH